MCLRLLKELAFVACLFGSGFFLYVTYAGYSELNVERRLDPDALAFVGEVLQATPQGTKVHLKMKVARADHFPDIEGQEFELDSDQETEKWAQMMATNYRFLVGSPQQCVYFRTTKTFHLMDEFHWHLSPVLRRTLISAVLAFMFCAFMGGFIWSTMRTRRPGPVKEKVA